MKKLVLQTPSHASTLLVGESLSQVNHYFHSPQSVMVVDENVFKYYQKELPHLPHFIVPSGETSKNLSMVQELLSFFLDQDLDRTSFVLGVGGGVVCDIVGLAASLYMRGLPFGFISTTLLSQVDASIGGKNGVNFKGFKNLIGLFSQPTFVLCDPHILKTVPPRHLLCGFAEMVKHALIESPEYFSQLEANSSLLQQLDEEALGEAIYESLLIKRKIVESDERERGERQKLNFGHTIGHAIESLGQHFHGEAVSLGMMFAMKLSHKKGLLQLTELKRVQHLLSQWGLPTVASLNKEEIKKAVQKDKKKRNDKIQFVLLNGIGQSVIEPISISQLREYIDDLLESV